MQERLMAALSAKRLPQGVSLLPGNRWAAHVHVGGRPMWGQVRGSLEDALADRKQLVAVKKKGLAELEAFLLALRPAT